MNEMVVTTLRTEYLDRPLGLGVPSPRFSWVLESKRRSERQTAYRILVASHAALLERDVGDIWDSGNCDSGRSIQIAYDGPPLASRQRYYWKVRVWDANGEPSAWSEISWWEMGLLDESEWRGSWIGGPPPGDDASQPCPFLRRPFVVRGPVARARLYITALGLFEPYLNGRKVGHDLFVPGWTDYTKRVEVLTYDVTSYMHQGDNALGAILGDGWACGYLLWDGRNRFWTEQPLLLAQLEIDYADGGREVIATDEAWMTTTGPILVSDIYHGEVYDARLELPGWAETGCDDGAWTAAEVNEPKVGRLVAKRVPPVRAVAEIEPVSLSEPVPGTFVFDLGQNIVGRVRLRVEGQPGDKVTLRFAERLEGDGTLYTEALRTARATDIYVLKGDGVEEYEPHFTFHGFQYVEVTGCPDPELGAVTGIVLHSDLEQTGSFECSDPLVNRLQQNILWGQKGNYLEVPTDCPQRDERLGWTGDAQVFIRTACFNMDVAPFFTKWLYDLEDAQSEDGAFPNVAPKAAPGEGVAAWADAGVLCPWAIYQWYGDLRVLDTHYGAMARWIDFMERTSDGLIRPEMGFGDWLAPNAKTPGDAATPRDLIGTAFFARCSAIMAEVARILGRQDDAARYQRLAADVVEAFNGAFVTPSGRLAGHTQTAYLLALAFDLLPESKRQAALDYLLSDLERRGWHLTTGFVGTPLLAPTLSRFGRTDIAYTLLFQEDYPSWLFTVRQGATSMWERWDGWTEASGFASAVMNSFNHYAYGSIGEWLYAVVAGIDFDPACPGYKHVILRPEPGGRLTWARAELRSMHGPIRCGWSLEGDAFHLAVDIPANTTATVILPTLPEGITEGGRPLSEREGVTVHASERRPVLRIGSGSYEFRASLPARADTPVATGQ